MFRKLRKKLLLSLAFGALVFIALTVYADADRLIEVFTRFKWEYAPLILGCTLLNYTFRYWKWDYYTTVLDIRPRTSQNIIIFFAAFLMAVTPGKLGEVLKSYLLKEVNNTPITTSAPIIFAERLTDFIGLILIMLAGAYVFGYAQGIIILFALTFALITVILSWRKGSLTLIGLLKYVPFIKKWVHHAEKAYESMYALLRIRPLFVAVVLSIIAWSFECMGFWLVLHVFEAPPTMLKAAFIYAFSTIVGAITMLPGGLGTTEGSLTGLTVLAGAPKNVAVASTFIIRVATLWFAVLVGVVVTLVFQNRLQVKIEDIEIESLPSSDI